MLARTAAKTSPFSSWMTTAPATWGAAAASTDTGRLVGELDGAVAGVLTAALRDRVDRYPTAALSVNPSLVQDGNGYVFLRADGPAGPERMVRAQRHPAIDAVLDVLGPGDTVGSVAARLGDGGARLVEQCIRSGLVEVRSPVPDHDPRPWSSWAGVVSGDDPELHVDPGASATALGRVASRLEVDPPPGALHEMRVADAAVAAAPQRLGDEEILELDSIRCLLALFDQKLPMKIAAAEFLAATFGVEHDIALTVALDAIQRATADPASDLGRLMGPMAPPWGPDLARCTSLRLRQLGEDLSEVSEAVLLAAEHGALSVPFVEDLVEKFPERHPNASATMYLQFIDGAGPLRRALNVVHGGHGRGRGRFAAQASLPVGQLGVDIADEVVELGGLLGSTLNVRSATCRRELQYPGSASGRPGHERLLMSDVRVVPGADGLPWLTADGRRVRPVHLGMAADLALPLFARRIEQVFGSAYLLHPSAPPFAPARPGEYRTAEAHTPRVVVGATVVQRARWFLRVEALPAPTNVAATALQEWHSWVTERGLPTRFFLRAWDPADAAGRSKARKPVFIDLTSRLLLADAEKMLRDAQFAIVEECLPDPLNGNGPVAEYAIEVGARE
jgi:Lantibiotic dehydratase, N terminus